MQFMIDLMAAVDIRNEKEKAAHRAAKDAAGS